MDWLITLWLLGAFAPVAFVTMCCCGVCNNCNGTPEQFQVSLTGIADGTCGDCEQFDGTYTCDRGQTCNGVANECHWSYCDLSGPYCTGAYDGVDVDVNVSLSGINYSVGVSLRVSTAVSSTYGVNLIQWVEAIGTVKPECSGFMAFDVTFSNNLSGDCDGSASTASVSAL